MPRVTSRTSNTSKQPSAARPLRLWQVLFRPRLWLLGLLLTGIALTAPFVPVWQEQLRSSPEYQISPADIRVSPAHHWVPVTLVSEILSELPPRLSLLDDGLVKEIANLFAHNPWVEQVRLVSKSRDGIDVDVVYRTPVLFVRNELGFYPVDRQGVLLPPTDFTAEDVTKLPVLILSGVTPTGRPGRRWEENVVQEAVQFASALAPEGDTTRYWQRFGLTAIRPLEDIAEGSTPSFLLETSGGSRILWGRHLTRTQDTLEPTTEQKLLRLAQYLETYGDFESPAGPYHIDIRHFEHISRKPLEPGIR